MDRQIRIRDGAKAQVLLNTEYLQRLYSTKCKSPAFHFHLFVGSTVVRWVATPQCTTSWIKRQDHKSAESLAFAEQAIAIASRKAAARQERQANLKSILAPRP
jgi:hypothetical protein